MTLIKIQTRLLPKLSASRMLTYLCAQKKFNFYTKAAQNPPFKLSARSTQIQNMLSLPISVILKLERGCLCETDITTVLTETTK